MSWNWQFTARTKSDAKKLVAKRQESVGQSYQAPQFVFDAINANLDAMGRDDNPISVSTSGHVSSADDNISSCMIEIRQLYTETP